jgi:hypothetical protein
VGYSHAKSTLAGPVKLNNIDTHSGKASRMDDLFTIDVTGDEMGKLHVDAGGGTSLEMVIDILLRYFGCSRQAYQEATHVEIP